MPDENLFKTATAGYSKIPNDWMPATGVRAFVFEDPVLVWLEHHGDKYNFVKDPSTPYDFTTFIFEKGQEFERKWIKEMANEAVRVCNYAFEVKSVEKFQHTLDLMNRSVPLIAAPALWWAPEKVYGVADLLVHTNWLRKHLPQIKMADHQPDHYVVFDMKFTTRLDSSQKKLAFANYSAQVRIYSYIMVQLQAKMAQYALLVTRDRITNPIEIKILSSVGGQLDEDLRAIRDKYLDIKLNGAKYMPWVHKEVEVNLSNDEDDPWHTAKVEIARNKIPGGDPCLLYQIGRKQKEDLARLGFPSLDSLAKADPDPIPLERCYNLGAVKSRHIRAVLRANRDGKVTPTSISRVPERKKFELFVDFETLNNLNVDFDRQWPTLEGCPIIFMIGVGWEENGDWKFRVFTAEEESLAGESALLAEFIKFLEDRTGGKLMEPRSTVLYHWTSAEVSELKRAADRQGLSSDHVIRKLNWYDLEKEIFLAEPIGIPEAWNYKLKNVALALSLVNWPGDLDEGLRASVAGWKAYKTTSPLNSAEMKTVIQYNEVDCKALWKIMKWLRS